MSNNEYDSPKGILFCFCAPSGSGKTTICKELLTLDQNLGLSVSTTTRKPRQGEVDGKDYYFVSEEEFQKRLQADLFVEHNMYAGNFYGTEKKVVNDSIKNSQDLLFDIDVHGVENLKKYYPDRVVSIFVFPPSFKVLKERLDLRASEDPEKLKSRLNEIQNEISFLRKPGFSDYLLINDKLERSLQLAQSIITVERVRFKRFSASFVDKMLN